MPLRYRCRKKVSAISWYLNKFIEVNFSVGCMVWPWCCLLQPLTTSKTINKMVKIAIYFYKILGLIVTLFLWTFFPFRGENEWQNAHRLIGLQKFTFFKIKSKQASKSDRTLSGQKYQPLPQFWLSVSDLNQNNAFDCMYTNS